MFAPHLSATGIAAEYRTNQFGLPRNASVQRENANFEFDRLQKLDESAKKADATYKLFSAEYSNSHSREEFHEKVRDRLEKESFRMNLTEAKALSRTYVSDKK